jgi:dihydrodipicolinate synthase/N-acetylneuraminate lyase
MYQHIKAIAASVGIGVVVIKSPESDLTDGTMNELSKINNVVAVKFEPGGNELALFTDTMSRVGDELAWIVNTHHENQLASRFYKTGARAFMDAIAQLRARSRSQDIQGP